MVDLDCGLPLTATCFHLQSHPRLVIEEERQASSSTLSRSSSRDKGKEKAVDGDDKEAPTTSLRCLNCSCVLLSYPAEPTSSPIAPKSTTGKFSIDLSPSSKLVVGSEKIADLSSKDKNPDWSDLFRLVMPTSDAAGSTIAGSGKVGVEDDSGIDTSERIASSSSMSRRTPSTDTVDSKKSDGTDDRDAVTSSPALRRTSSLKRTNSGSGSGSGSRTLSAGDSAFHSTAKARIKQNRQELEAQIARLREEFDAQSKRYLEQADMLASKLKAGGRSSKRTSSPSTKKGTTKKDDTTGTGESTHVIMRGGFDSPTSETMSPSQSHNSALGTSRTPITSPHLATAGNFPALFSSMSGATNASSPTTAESLPSREPKKAGIIQPTQPQSPTFRRSRSPSPSRDTSKGRTESRDRAGTQAAAGGSDMERRPSDEAHNVKATTSKRPALNLMRDVSNLEQDMQQKKADKATEETRGRTTAAPGTSLPTHSVLRNKGEQTHISTSYAGRAAPRPRGTWLRLNGLSPSPPEDRLLLDRPVPDSIMEVKEDAEETAGDDNPKRTSLSKHRHVSFKEPEPGSSVEASPAPVEAPLSADLADEEEDEVPFDMDEDIQRLADDETDEEDADFVNIETPGDADDAPDGQVTRDSVAPGSVSEPSISISLTRDIRSQAADSLSALLNNPSSFIGSLKSRNYGASVLSGHSPYDQDSGRNSSSPRDRVSLSDQAQKLRDLLALDAPSHRGTKSKRDRALASYLRDRPEKSTEEDIKDDELDSLAPVSALATSLPVAIGFHGVNKKDEYEFERKTSVPQRESMLVPRLYDAGRHRAAKPGQYSPFERLPSLGEESESAHGSRAPSPGGVQGPINTGTGDALAAGNDESDETRDQLRELQNKEAFIPPHVSHSVDSTVIDVTL